jgi:hypothetical protein
MKLRGMFLQLYMDAIQRAEYYRWAAMKGHAMPGNDPLTGQSKTGFMSKWSAEGIAVNKTLAKFWLAKAAEIRGKA